jgi:hypothetical protein
MKTYGEMDVQIHVFLTSALCCIPEEGDRERPDERQSGSWSKEGGDTHQRIDIHVVEEFRKI